MSSRKIGAANKASTQTSRANCERDVSQILIVGEEEEAFKAFAVKIIEDLQPVGFVEEDLAKEVAILSWRLKRIPRLEAAVIAARDAATAEKSPARQEKARRDHLLDMRDRYLLHGKPDQEKSEGSTSAGNASKEEEDATQKEETKEDAALASQEAIGRALIHDSGNGDVLGKIQRTETSLNNSLRIKLSILKTLQSARYNQSGSQKRDEARREGPRSITTAAHSRRKKPQKA